MPTKKLPRPTRRPRPTWNTPIQPMLRVAAPVQRIEDDTLFDGLYMRLGYALIAVGTAEPDSAEKEQAVALMLERQKEFLDYATSLLVNHAPTSTAEASLPALNTLVGRRPIRHMTHRSSHA